MTEIDVLKDVILKLTRNQIDLEYIKKWCNYFAMNDLFERVINEK